MIFKDLRTGMQIFVLDKGVDMGAQVYPVHAVGQPYLKQQDINMTYPYQPEYLIDISVKNGDEMSEIKKLPASAEMADFPVDANGRKLVVSSNRGLMLAEVETMMANSNAVIDSVDRHRDIVEKCGDILTTLNPSLAKEKEQEDKIARLEGSIDELKRLVVQMSKGNNSKS